MFFNTRMGDRIKFLESNAPGDGYSNFLESVVSSLASSSGMPLSVLWMKMNTSFSAARGELLLFWRSVVIGRENMGTDYLNLVFEAWMSEEIAAGRISAPGWADPILRAAWLNCTWVGGPMPNIDPLRTAKGDKEYLGMSATTGERIALEHNGSDFKSNVMKNQVGFKSMPIPYWDPNQKNKINNNNN